MMHSEHEQESISSDGTDDQPVDWLHKQMAEHRRKLEDAIAADDTVAAKKAKEVCNQLQKALNRRMRFIMARPMYDTLKFMVLYHVRSADDYYMSLASQLSNDTDVPKVVMLAILRELIDEGMVEMHACFNEDDGTLNGSGYQRTMAGDTTIKEVVG